MTVVYMPERDTAEMLGPMFNYSLGSYVVELKLKFKIGPIKGLSTDDLSLAKLVDRIVLGPSINSPMSIAALKRMLDILNHSDLKSKLHGSKIPFRAIG